MVEIWTIGEVPIKGRIGASEFGISRVLKMRHPGHQKSRNRERRSGPSILKGRVAAIEAFGKGPDRRATSGNQDRDIGNPVDTGFMHFSIAMSETPIGDKAVVLWDSGHMGQELSQEG
jgi:hypothetical protein